MTVVNIYSSGMWRLAALCLMYGASECVRVSQWRARKYNVCENVLRFGQITLPLHMILLHSGNKEQALFPLVCNIIAYDKLRLGSVKVVKTLFFHFAVALALQYHCPQKMCAEMTFCMSVTYAFMNPKYKKTIIQWHRKTFLRK
ncbi:unknown [Prevotella sp. CAG:487]|nr:unknown [Prevotella sp. CAG:487]